MRVKEKLVKASEATTEQLRVELVKSFDAMAATVADPSDVKIRRLGRFILLDVGHFEDLHASSGMGEGEVLLTKQAIKSCTMYYHDSPEVVETMKKQRAARRKQLREEKKKKEEKSG